MLVPFFICFALKIRKKSNHFFGFTPFQHKLEISADLERACERKDGVMVDDGVIEEEGVGLGHITKKTTRKMPKKKRKFGRYLQSGKKQSKNPRLASHPNPNTPPSHSSPTLRHTVRQNASLHISKVEFATILKSTRIKARLTENELEKRNLENTSLKTTNDRQAALRRKDRQKIVTLGSLLTKNRKFGKKTSSALIKSKMKVSELELSLELVKAEYTLRSVRNVVSNNEEREVSSNFFAFVFTFVM